MEEIDVLEEAIQYVDEQKDHSKLTNLDYENSGHTGFQKELTAGQNITIENNVISATGGGILPDYPTFDKQKKYVLTLAPNQQESEFELQWLELTSYSDSKLITSDGFVFQTVNNENVIVKEVL